MKTEDLTNLGINTDKLDREVVSRIPGLLSKHMVERESARKELEKMGESALEDVHQLIHSSSKQLRWESAKIIQHVASKKSIPVLIMLLKDTDSDISWIASEGLIRVGRACIIPLLEEITRKVDTLFFYPGAHHVLIHLLKDKEKQEYKDLISSLANSDETPTTASVKAFEVIRKLKKKK